MSLLLLAALSATLPAQGSGPFGAPLPLFASIVDVSAETVLDLDGDGRLDVVLGSRTSRNLVAILNIDGERFAAPAVHTTLAQRTRALAAGDLDGNGTEDLVQLDHQGRVVWIPTDPDGHASSPRTVGHLVFGSVPAQSSVTVADLDGDGTLDVCGATRSETLYWRGLGGGAFANAAPLVATGLESGLVFPFDLDGDGDLDILALQARVGGGSTTAGVLYFENTAGFPLDPVGAVPVGQTDTFPLTNAYDLSAADFDLDGDLDLLVNQFTLHFVENRGPAGFAENVPVSTVSPFSPATVGDFDADGRPDFAAYNGTDGMGFWRGAGDGSFTLAQTYSGSPSGLRTADLTGDGIVDWLLISSVQGMQRVEVFAGGQGSPAPGPALRLNPSNGWRAMGLMPSLIPSQAPDAGFDLVTYEEDERILYRRPANGLGFGAPERLVALGEGGPLSGLFEPAFGDVDGDGIRDIVFGLDGRLEFLPGLADGSFSTRQPLLANGNPIVAQGLELRFADLDGVHGDDLLYRDGTRTFGALRNAAGGFASPVALGAGNLSEPAKAVLADIDGDGLVDLVYDLMENIEWSRNLGAGLFQSRQVLATLPSLALRPVALDVDEDGDLDLITSNQLVGGTQHEVAWLRNDGASGFTAPMIIGTFTFTVLDLEVLDFDLDGFKDLLVRGGGRLFLIPRTGAAVFAPPIEVLTGLLDAPSSTGNLPANYEIRYADLDGDGDRDFVLGGGRDGAITIVPNNTFGVVGQPYCTAADTSLGAPARLTAYGSTEVDRNAVELRAWDLPPSTFGYFLNSLNQDSVPAVGGSAGNLCLGSSIGRYIGSGEVGFSGSAGSISLTLNPAQTPTPMGFVSVQVGQTWYFQCWFRDLEAGQLTANLTPGLEIRFR